MSVKTLESLFCNSTSNMSGGGIQETNLLLKFVIVILVIYAVYYYFDNKNKKVESPSTQQQLTSQLTTQLTSQLATQQDGKGSAGEIIVPVKRVGGTYGDIYPVLRDYDYRTYQDDLTPPRKRDDYDIPANVFYPDRFGLYTRGGPNPFKKMGYLNNKNAQPGDPYKFLTLMGRQKYYNSNTYEYYVVSTNKDENIKFDLDNKRELFTGDKVKVHQLNNTEYEAHIDKVLDYEYNPFII